MEKVLGTIYASSLLGDAALIVPSLIWSKVKCLLYALTAT